MNFWRRKKVFFSFHLIFFSLLCHGIALVTKIHLRMIKYLFFSALNVFSRHVGWLFLFIFLVTFFSLQQTRFTFIFKQLTFSKKLFFLRTDVIRFLILRRRRRDDVSRQRILWSVAEQGDARIFVAFGHYVVVALGRRARGGRWTGKKWNRDLEIPGINTNFVCSQIL
jgi:hypothetical protein